MTSGGSLVTVQRRVAHDRRRRSVLPIAVVPLAAPFCIAPQNAIYVGLMGLAVVPLGFALLALANLHDLRAVRGRVT